MTQGPPSPAPRPSTAGNLQGPGGRQAGLELGLSDLQTWMTYPQDARLRKRRPWAQGRQAWECPSTALTAHGALAGSQGLAVGGHLLTALPWSSGSWQPVHIPTLNASTEYLGHWPVSDLRTPGQGTGLTGQPHAESRPGSSPQVLQTSTSVSPAPNYLPGKYTKSVVSWPHGQKTGLFLLRT